jgi:hypothetical protein
MVGQKKTLRKLIRTELRPIIEKCEELALSMEELAAQNQQLLQMGSSMQGQSSK